MESYSKKKGKRTRRRCGPRRQKGGQIITLRFITPSSINAVIQRMSLIPPQDLSSITAQYYLNIISSFEKLPSLIELGAVHSMVTAALQTNTPAAFAAFSNICRIDAVVTIFVITEELARTELIPHFDIVINLVILNSMNNVFNFIKTVTPVEVNMKGPNALKHMDDMSRQLPAETFNKLNTILSDSILQIYWLITLRVQGLPSPQDPNNNLYFISPSDLITYPIWPAILMSEFPIVTYTQQPTFLFYLKAMCINIIADTVIASLQSQQPVISIQAPSPIPNGIIVWLTANSANVAKSLRAYIRGAIRFITNTFPNIPQIPGNLSVPTGIKMPAAIVSWLQAQMNLVPQNVRSNLKGAYTYIQRIFPADTTPSQVKAAENKLIFVP